MKYWFFVWLIFQNSLLGSAPVFTPVLPCAVNAPVSCAALALMAAEEARYLSRLDILAMVYGAELASFRAGGRAATQASYEALFRSYFDRVTGGDETAQRLVRWLANVQPFRGAVRLDGTVDYDRLFRVDYKAYEIDLVLALVHHPEWRTGQSPNHPSQWGSVCVAPGDTVVKSSSEVFVTLFTHAWADHKYTFNSDLRGGQIPVSTLLSEIVSTQGRLKTGVSTCE